LLLKESIEDEQIWRVIALKITGAAERKEQEPKLVLVGVGRTEEHRERIG
jgi:hypothetical protein